jgi:predicted acyltransferase
VNRLQSIDVLRGLTVALMIIVNTPGNEAHAFAPLVHAAWHGFTLTDLVFPTFLFAVGNALAFTFQRQADARTLWPKTLRRVLLILLFGLLLNELARQLLSLPGGTRIPGVLQRIALCFGLATAVLYFFRERAVVAFSVFALLAYGAMLALFGDTTVSGNVGLRIDLWLFGPSHLYRGEGIPFDPEGLLGTLPATVNVLGGYAAGRMLMQSQAVGMQSRVVSRLLWLGLALLTLGLCWNQVQPINKKLWTSSYVLLTLGLDFIILAVLQAIGSRKWMRFFEVFGKNALAIYLLSELAVIALLAVPVGKGNALGWVYQSIFEGMGSMQLGSLLFAIAFMLACWLVAYALDRKGIYFKV